MLRFALSQLFRSGVALRNAAYDHGWRTALHPGVPVISVGNLSMGGTGKTPLVERIIEELLPDGLMTLVTRGYRRRTRGFLVVSDGRGRVGDVDSCGDEAVQTARRFPSLVVIADEHRARGCARAVSEHGARRIILDDAFQHRRCARDVDIVVVDASRDHRAERLFPLGRLREPWPALRRATAVVLTRYRSARDPDALETFLHGYGDAPVFRSDTDVRALRALRALDGTPLPEDEPAGGDALCFCGIGSPEAFAATVRDLGVEARDLLHFPDHHPYSDADLAAIVRRARELGTRLLLTTEKDAMRLAGREPAFGDLRVCYPEIRAVLCSGEEAFVTLLRERTGERRVNRCKA